MAVPELKRKATLDPGICSAKGCRVTKELRVFSILPKNKGTMLFCRTHALESGMNLDEHPPLPDGLQMELPQTAVANDAVKGEIVPFQQEVQESTNEVIGVLAEVHEIEINNQDELDVVSEYLAEVKGKSKRLKELEQTIVRPMNESLKATRAIFAPAINKWLEVEKIIKEKTIVYLNKLKEQRQLAIEQVNDSATSEEISMALSAMQAAQPPVNPATLSTREMWCFEVDDESQVPREFLSVDSQKINAVIREGVRSIPGVRIFQKTIVSSKAV